MKKIQQLQQQSLFLRHHSLFSIFFFILILHSFLNTIPYLPTPLLKTPHTSLPLLFLANSPLCVIFQIISSFLFTIPKQQKKITHKNANCVKRRREIEKKNSPYTTHPPTDKPSPNPPQTDHQSFTLIPIPLKMFISLILSLFYVFFLYTHHTHT